MISEPLLKITAISALIQCAALTIAAYLYYDAYKQMKRSPIIGLVSATCAAGAFVGLSASLVNLFPCNFLAGVLILSRTGLVCVTIMFIKASLTPGDGKVKNLGIPVKSSKSNKNAVKSRKPE